MRTTILSIIIALMQLCASAQSTFEEQIATASKTIADGLNLKQMRKVAVTEFRDLDGAESLLGKYIADEVGINLVNYAETYELIERTRLDALLKEQKLSAEAIINDSTRAEIGRIYGVEAIVIGTITVFETELRLTMRAIDTETGSLLKVAAVDVEKNERIKTLLSEKKSTVNQNGVDVSKLPSFVTEQKNNASVAVNTTRKANDPNCGQKNVGDICMTNLTNYDLVEAYAQLITYTKSTTLELRKGESQCLYSLPAQALTFKFKYFDVDQYGKRTEKDSRSIQIPVEKCVSKDYQIK